MAKTGRYKRHDNYKCRIHTIVDTAFLIIRKKIRLSVEIIRHYDMIRKELRRDTFSFGDR